MRSVKGRCKARETWLMHDWLAHIVVPPMSLDLHAPVLPNVSELLDSAAIHALLGHRYPFVLVDRIVIEEAARASVQSRRRSDGADDRCTGIATVDGRLVASAERTTVIRASQRTVEVV
jgi:hypothetical protein